MSQSARLLGGAALQSVRENWCFIHWLRPWAGTRQCKPFPRGLKPAFLALNAGLKARSTVSGWGEERQVLSSVTDLVALKQSLKACAAQKLKRMRLFSKVVPGVP